MEDLFVRLSGSWTTALPSLREFLVHLLLAFVLGQALAWVYVRTHRGTSYSRSIVHALVLLALIVTLVMLAIGDSLARAIGLFGALALVRFRTPVKDTRDTVFLFLAVGIGIAVGTSSLLLAVAGTIFALGIACYLDWTRFGEREISDSVLRLRMPSGPEPEGALREILGRYCRRFALLNARDSLTAGEMEFAYQLELRDIAATAGMVAAIRAIPGAGDVNLMMQTEQEEL
ncbi:MAG: DUF4956 domain-containing protein [Planctomycetes bacterium]|nr:DUF4956 domain-containing protein [Planctomycetota bacterium]